MDPHGPIARRFPLVARFRPACLPLPERVEGLVGLARRAEQLSDQGLVSAVFNQAALIASDVGLPDLARAMCHRHAQAYLAACPLPAESAIRGLEPLINLARLQIRAGHTDEARRRLLDLYEAVGTGTPTSFEAIPVPADLTRTDEDRREVRAWLWRVLLADGTRTLTTAGHWAEALAHIKEHRGVGARMLDGRQVAVVAALTEGDTDCAAALLTTTAPGEQWEQIVTACLTVLHRRDVGQSVDGHIAELARAYLGYEAKPGLTVFDVRLGLTVLDAIGPEHPGARDLVQSIVRRTADARDGYAGRELLAHPAVPALTTSDEFYECSEVARACAHGSGTLPDDLGAGLAATLETAGAVLTRALRVTSVSASAGGGAAKLA